MKVHAVIFDMDGLLFDTERLYLEQCRTTERELGLNIPSEIHEETIGIREDDAKQVYISRFGPDFPVEQFMLRTKALVLAYIDGHGIPVKNGAFELISELRRMEVCIVLASSSTRRVIEKYLVKAGWPPVFDRIISGEEVAAGKPAPDIFLAAAESVGVGPEECLVLEDSNNGIRAAFAAGMKPVMIPDVKPPDPDVREMVYKIYSDLRGVKGDLSLVCR